MKFLRLMLPLLTLQLLALDGHAQTITRADLKATVEHMQRIAKEAVIEADAARAKNVETTKALDQTRAALTDARSAVASLQVDVAKLTAWGETQQSLKNDALVAQAKSEKALAAEKARHDLLRNICGTVLGLLFALIVFKFVGPAFALLPQYIALACLGAFGAGFALVWIFL